MTANQGKVKSITFEDNVITVTVPVDELIAYESLNPAQGTHKWVAILITTGLPAITAVKYNDSQLTSTDADEAATVGGQAGDIVMKRSLFHKCNCSAKLIIYEHSGCSIPCFNLDLFPCRNSTR